MQMSRETASANLIHAFEPGRVRINEEWFTENLIITASEIVRDWTLTTPGTPSIADLEPVLQFDPELVIIGAGSGALTPDVDLMAELAARGIGLEYMQTAAACRTYNVVVHEGRRAVAGLILDTAS